MSHVHAQVWVGRVDTCVWYICWFHTYVWCMMYVTPDLLLVVEWCHAWSGRVVSWSWGHDVYVWFEPGYADRVVTGESAFLRCSCVGSGGAELPPPSMSWFGIAWCVSVLMPSSSMYTYSMSPQCYCVHSAGLPQMCQSHPTPAGNPA